MNMERGLAAHRMILISDSHVDDIRGNDAEFFEMLDAFSRTDDDIVFLGDIFDLWIGFPRYEKTIHRRFLSWCREQLSRRVVGFVEGNHEYFVVRERGSFFTWSTDGCYIRDSAGNCFVHGDQINTKDTNYLRFRKLAKNGVTRRIVRAMPFGPAIGVALKHTFKHTNLDFRKFLPETEIRLFAKNRFEKQAGNIFMGHFHQRYRLEQSSGKNLYIIPSWAVDGEVGLIREGRGFAYVHWKEALHSAS